MLAALLTALRTAFTGNATLTAAFPGGYHLDEAPEGTAMPYVVYTVIAAPTTLKYGGVCRSDAQIQFAAYGPDGGALLAAMETFCAAYDEVIESLATGTVTNEQRLGEPVPRLIEKDQNGNDVYQAAVAYEFNLRP